MNTLQIQKALQENVITRSIFLGVFPSDRLPTNIQRHPTCFIANVDSSGEPGSHWIACYISDTQRIEFFDSFGHSPAAFPGPLYTYITRFAEMDFNPIPLQSNVTAVCGHYCIYYIYSRCRGYTLKEIVAPFVPSHINNDIKVYNFVTKYFNVHANFYQ